MADGRSIIDYRLWHERDRQSFGLLRLIHAWKPRCSLVAGLRVDFSCTFRGAGATVGVFTDILAGFTFHNRVLRLPAVVLYSKSFFTSRAMTVDNWTTHLPFRFACRQRFSSGRSNETFDSLSDADSKGKGKAVIPRARRAGVGGHEHANVWCWKKAIHHHRQRRMSENTSMKLFWTKQWTPFCDGSSTLPGSSLSSGTSRSEYFGHPHRISNTIPYFFCCRSYHSRATHKAFHKAEKGNSILLFNENVDLFSGAGAKKKAKPAEWGHQPNLAETLKFQYCTARNFRQRKISSKATIRQFVRNLFSSNVGRCLLLFGRSVAALLLIVYLHINEYFWSHTCSFVKNLVRNLI